MGAKSSHSHSFARQSVTLTLTSHIHTNNLNFKLQDTVNVYAICKMFFDSCSVNETSSTNTVVHMLRRFDLLMIGYARITFQVRTPSTMLEHVIHTS